MAWRIRHRARLQARSMMADPDGPTFEFLVEKLIKAGLEGDAIYEAIIEGAYRTDTGINRLVEL